MTCNIFSPKVQTQNLYMNTEVLYHAKVWIEDRSVEDLQIYN